VGAQWKDDEQGNVEASFAGGFVTREEIESEYIVYPKESDRQN
jgi:hypothetical protein